MVKRKIQKMRTKTTKMWGMPTHTCNPSGRDSRARNLKLATASE